MKLNRFGRDEPGPSTWTYSEVLLVHLAMLAEGIIGLLLLPGRYIPPNLSYRATLRASRRQEFGGCEGCPEAAECKKENTKTTKEK